MYALIPLRVVFRVTSASQATHLIPPTPICLTSLATYSRYGRLLIHPFITGLGLAVKVLSSVHIFTSTWLLHLSEPPK
jgi:hypothetical protein